jgi:PAS domain S-box-containing protein
MNERSSPQSAGIIDLQPLWEGQERILYRGQIDGATDVTGSVLVAAPVSEHATVDILARLAHEYELAAQLNDEWAARPLRFVREPGRTMLVLRDPGGESLAKLLGSPMGLGQFLRLAVALAAAVGRLHAQGLIHKDINPANVLVRTATGQVWLTGFGHASRLPRERQSPEPPELVAGTLAYMSPEQTGRMNRSIDSRSDLYSLGVTFYELLTGSLPFTASDPLEWIHCHIARQPVPAAERLPDLPSPVSAIVSRLLAKTAEERYQTAAGVESDLRRCLAQWETQRRIDEFPLCENDTPETLLIPEKLYGREREIGTLLDSFDRVVAGGTPELVLVSGYSGIGKSSVVNELHKVLVPPRGLFASGKFDQYKRDIPYATLAQAFQSLVRRLLTKSEVELEPWRNQLLEALGPNGSLIVDLVPELELIIGAQPPVPELPPQDTKSRFQLVFRRFISVFARREHPLALFVDDLQWLDEATLDLLGDLLTQPDVRYLLLIGAYRDNEVHRNHPLMRKLGAIRETGAQMHEIVLAPLTLADLTEMLGDSFHCRPEQARQLAHAVHEKTDGNPFFAIQFVLTLAEEGLLIFDRDTRAWSWDLERIQRKDYTDNVVDLMAGKLSRLPVDTQTALKQLACVGNSADVGMLEQVFSDPSFMHRSFWEAVRAGLVLRSERAYSFLHDRVQEAAYSLIPEDARAGFHLEIARLLASRTTPAEIDDRVFEIVNQFNRASNLLTSTDERIQVAELNLVAGKRAQTSTAYTSALAYLAVGRSLLTEASWDARYELMFALELHTAECELLTANLAGAEDRLARLAPRARTLQHIAAIAGLRLALYTTLGRPDRAAEVCLEFLSRGGTHWPLRPTRAQVLEEYEQIWSRLGTRTIEELIDLPPMGDHEALAAIDVMSDVVPAALFTDENLVSLIICRMVNLSLEHGNTDGSCVGYVWFGIVAGPYFGNYEAGFKFGQLAYELVEKRRLQRFQARIYLLFGNLVMPWTRPIRTCRDLLRRAFETATKVGDLTHAGYTCNNLGTHLLASGDPLDQVEQEIENGLAFARNAGFGMIVDIISAQRGLVRTLRGLTQEFGSFNDEEFHEARFEQRLGTAAGIVVCWYWIRKLQARFAAEDYHSAIDASLHAQRLLWTSPSLLEVAEHAFYSALARAALHDSAGPDERREHFESLTAHHKQLEVWADHCPANFATRAALVGAEIARIEGRDLDAMHLYEESIRSARDNGFTHNEALAHELIGHFCLGRGLDASADGHLRNARKCYARWRADGKVRQLERRHPWLAEVELPSQGSTGLTVQNLDVTSVVSALQAVSREIVLPKLIETVMTIALENAGADRGLLILRQEELDWIEAAAYTRRGKVEVVLQRAPVSADSCADTLVRYVIRTQQSVIADDVSKRDVFLDDDYLKNHQVRSILGLPLVLQGKFVGVLYLENSLTAHAFTSKRIAVLELLAAQAAISLENTRLYSALQDREARVRRLVESNIIGVVIWDAGGRIIDANDAFLDIVQYSRSDSAGIKWTELTPPEWRATDERVMAQLVAAGAVQPFEKEYVRKDGSRVPVLVGAAMFEGSKDRGVAFVVDLSERKQAELKLRESEERYREAQMQLAHANRVTTMGQLTASIAHEVNQPIGAAVTNATAALRWLRAEPPDLNEVRLALERVVADGRRADEVVRRIRNLIKRTPDRHVRLDLNEVLLEVVALTRPEMQKNSVRLDTQLATDLPAVDGDRIQLQQVILNLIINAAEAMTGVTGRSRELVISTAKQGGEAVLVAARDSGPAFDPENAKRFFEPFYTTKTSGIGMGLTICRSIVEAHGGKLGVTANASYGATFYFTLPACAEA